MVTMFTARDGSLRQAKGNSTFVRSTEGAAHKATIKALGELNTKGTGVPVVKVHMTGTSFTEMAAQWWYGQCHVCKGPAPLAESKYGRVTVPLPRDLICAGCQITSHFTKVEDLVAEGWTGQAADEHLSGTCDQMVCGGRH